MFFISLSFTGTECDSCTVTLQLDLEKLLPVQNQLEQQLQNITNTPGSVLWLRPLEAKISKTQVRFT